MKDVFRPRTEPARTIYDAFQNEATKRDGRKPVEWMREELLAVWDATQTYGILHELQVPTLDMIKISEMSARGHVDYGAKWAYAIAFYMEQK